MTTDTHYMQQAIDQAQLAGPETWLNPRVGAVIVKDGHIISVGHTHQFGSIHAERDAISKLSPKELFHSTLYVTLEPCNHYGKQPPCSQLIIDSKISRVVIAETDPHPLVTGKGIAKLKSAGIQVDTGVLSRQASQVNQHYNFFFAHQRPWITVKQAVSLDYKVSEHLNKRTAITNQEVYAKVHRERADYHGIVIGSQTAIIDNPSLLTTVKSSYPPVRIILDRRGRLVDHWELKLLTDRRASTWIMTENPQVKKALADLAVRVFTVKDLTPANAVALIATQGLQSLYIEGGPTIQKAFIKVGLVDELLTYLSPQLLGIHGVPALQPSQAMSFKQIKLTLLGNNVRIMERNEF